MVRGYTTIVHEMEDALSICQCTLSNVPQSEESLQLKFIAKCGLFRVMTVLTCSLHITGKQNPSFGRKSYGYSFWAADGVIDMVIIEPGTTINSEH